MVEAMVSAVSTAVPRDGTGHRGAAGGQPRCNQRVLRARLHEMSNGSARVSFFSINKRARALQVQRAARSGKALFDGHFDTV
jgi:hypothetical protein